MTTIVTRASKGSALTWTEGDDNITNLNNDKIEAVADDTTPQLGGDLDVNGNKIVSVSNGNIALEPDGTGIITANKNIETTGDLKANELWSTWSSGDEGGQINLAQAVTNSTLSGDTVTVDIYQNKLRIFEQGGDARGVYIDLTAAAAGVGTNLLSGGGGGIASLADDTTPQLGGDLDVAGFAIDNSDNDTNTNNIIFGPATNNYNTVLLTSQSGMNLNVRGSAGSALEYSDSTPQDASVSVSGSGVFLYSSNGSGNDYVGFGPSGGLYFKNGAGINGGDSATSNLDITSGTDSNIAITPNGTGDLILDGLKWPQADGSANQVLKTNGSGQLSWTTVSSGGVAQALLTSTGYNITISASTSGTLLATAGEGWVEASDPSGIVTITSDGSQNTRFTLGAGTYIVELISTGMLLSGSTGTTGWVSLGGIQFDLYNHTTSSTLMTYYAEGPRIYSGSSSTAEIPMGPVHLIHSFSITGSNTYYFKYVNTNKSKQFNAWASPGKAFSVKITKLA